MWLTAVLTTLPRTAGKEDLAAFFSLFRVAHCLLVTGGERQCSVVRSELVRAAVGEGGGGGGGGGAGVGRARIRKRWSGAASGLRYRPAASALEPPRAPA